MKRIEIVSLAQGALDQEWQRYVNTSPQASQYHRLEWREILLRSFGHRSWYLILQECGETRGVLPLVEIKSIMFGHFFVSLPFIDHAGIVADGSESEADLASAAADLAEGRGAHYIELRQLRPSAGLASGGWKLRQHKASLVIPMNDSLEAKWAGLSSRLRGKVRKAERSGATFVAGNAEQLNEFYSVFALNMRNLGTPVYSIAFFQNVLRFAEDTAVLLVRLEGRPAAGAIALRNGDRIELPWICSDYAHASFNVNEFLYWNTISWAYKTGARELDFGRCSIDSGPYRFKMQWNPDVRPLYWYHRVGPRGHLPDLSPDNSKYALAVRCWKKMPLAIANGIGPWIVRNIP